MYCVTKIALDCANAARELSQFMVRPTQEHWSESHGAIGGLHRAEKEPSFDLKETKRIASNRKRRFEL
jgi:hypothetical protein